MIAMIAAVTRSSFHRVDAPHHRVGVQIHQHQRARTLVAHHQQVVLDVDREGPCPQIDFDGGIVPIVPSTKGSA